MGDLGLRNAVVMGFAQALALAPGVSRSGVTITAALARGFRREDAARFSFLLARLLVAAIATGCAPTASVWAGHCRKIPAVARACARP